MRTFEPTRKTKPRKTSDRARPNKTHIQKMAEYRGYQTANEKTQLTGLKVKNALQRVNSKSMKDEGENFTTKENAEIQRLMKQFVRGINKILDK